MISGWVPRCGYGPPHPDHPALHLLHFRCPSMDEGPSILQIWSTGEGSGCVWQVWRFVSAPHKPGGSSDEAMISRTIVYDSYESTASTSNVVGRLPPLGDWRPEELQRLFVSVISNPRLDLSVHLQRMVHVATPPTKPSRTRFGRVLCSADPWDPLTQDGGKLVSAEHVLKMSGYSNRLAESGLNSRKKLSPRNPSITAAKL
ncbi:hypothetical protein ZWY2020_016997 [Hordeum vulgare]|nr:hypothetical protein ZWY2020_016997 [Hordeum vulgare]